MVAEANAAAFNKAHHPGHHELIAVGQSYMGLENQSAIVDNDFANLANIRRRARA